MLNIQFEVRGDATDKLVELQAKGVIAALLAIYGDKILPTTRVAIASKGAPEIGPDTRSNIEIAQTTDEPSASEAFEGNQAEYLAVHAPEEPDAASAFGGAPTPASDVERDSAGIPYDARIHSGTKGVNKDGTWARRRNTPDDLFNSVMAELKAANTQRTLGAATALIPPPPSSVPAPPPATAAPSAPPVAPAASSPVPAGLIDPNSATAFPDLMKEVTKAQAAGKITPDGVNNLLISLGLEPKITSLLANKALIPAFQELLIDHVKMQG
jgi:hypothetical protein